MKLCINSLFRCPSEAQVTAVKHNEGGFQRNITKDIDTNSSAALQAAEASSACAVGRRKVHVLARDGDGGTPNAKGEVWQRSGALEGITTLGIVVLGTADLGVVGVDDVVIEEKQRGASVGNTGDGLSLERTAADGVAGRREAPEAFAVVNGCVGDGAGVLGTVDVAKVVLAIYWWLVRYKVDASLRLLPRSRKMKM